MEFTGFSAKDFETFQLDGLAERMEAIQTRIQPKFRQIGEQLTSDLSIKLGNEMFLHIAKHARRTVNPPKDTWLAVCNNKRGYKKHPHFQVGLFDDRLFIWLAFIYELPHKESIARNFQKHIDEIEANIPDHFVISQDHMKKDAVSMKDADVQAILSRFEKVKKAEFLVGVHIDAHDEILQDGEQLLTYIQETIDALIPIYQLAYTES